MADHLWIKDRHWSHLTWNSLRIDKYCLVDGLDQRLSASSGWSGVIPAVFSICGWRAPTVHALPVRLSSSPLCVGDFGVQADACPVSCCCLSTIRSILCQGIWHLISQQLKGRAFAWPGALGLREASWHTPGCGRGVNCQRGLMSHMVDPGRLTNHTQDWTLWQRVLVPWVRVGVKGETEVMGGDQVGEGFCYLTRSLSGGRHSPYHS